MLQNVASRLAVALTCALGVAFLSGARRDAKVTAIAECMTCTGWDSEGTHSFAGQLSCSVGSSCFDCDYLNSCHPNAQTGACNEYHWECGRASLAVAALEMSLVNAEPREIALVVGEYPDALYVNEERALLQVLNCRGSVVARYRLDDQVAIALE